MPCHSTTYRVPYADTDQMGIVYHANYLKYFEISRTEMLRAQGVAYRDLEAQDLLLQVVGAELAFHHPARYDDLIELRTSVLQVGAASILLQSEAWLDNRCLATGKIRLAAVAKSTGRVTRLPDTLKDTISDTLCD